MPGQGAVSMWATKLIETQYQCVFSKQNNRQTLTCYQWYYHQCKPLLIINIRLQRESKAALQTVVERCVMPSVYLHVF